MRNDLSSNRGPRGCRRRAAVVARSLLLAVAMTCLLLPAKPSAAQGQTAAARAESLAAAVRAHILLARRDTLGAMAAAYRGLPEFRGGAGPDVPQVRQALLSAYAASHLVAAYDRKATAAALSPDGRRIAMALKDGIEVRSLDPDARLFFLKLPSPPADSTDALDTIVYLDIAADGRHILAASLRHYWVWPLDGGATVHSGTCGDFPDAEAARFIGNGMHVLVKCGSDLKILDAADLHAVLELHDVSIFAASRDGRLVATDKEVRTIHDGKVVLTLLASDDPASAVAFAPDGRSLALARYRSVAIWSLADPAAKTPQFTIDIQSAVGATWVAYAPDGKSLVTLSSGEIRVFEAEGGELTAVWSDNRTNLSSEILGPDRAYVSRDGRWLLTASSWQDGMFTTRSTLWSLIHHDALPIRVTRGEAELAAAAFTQAAAPIFATVDRLSERGGVFVWSAESSLTLHRWTDYVAGSFELIPIAAGSNDIILRSSEDQSLKRCRVDTFVCEPAAASALEALDSVIATPKGKAILSVQGDTLVATYLKDGTVAWRRTVAGTGSVPSDYTVFSNGAYVLWSPYSGSPHPDLVLRASDGVPIQTLGDVTTVTPLSGPVVLVTKRPKVFALVNLDTGRATPIDLPGVRVYSVAMSADGVRAAIVTGGEDAGGASGTDQFLTVITTADGHVVQTRPMTEGLGLVSRPAFSPDGRTILIGDRIIDATSGNQIATLASDTPAPVWSSRYSPDGRLIFAFSDAGLAHATTLRIFAADGMLLQTFLTAPSLLLQFSQDGKAYVVQDYDGLGVHLVPSPDVVAARTRRLLDGAGLLAQH